MTQRWMPPISDWKRESLKSPPMNISEDVIINYAPDGRVVGIEILSAAKHLFGNKKQPQVILENIQAVNQ